LFEAGTFVPVEFEKVVVKYYQMSRCLMKGSRPMQTVKPTRQKPILGPWDTLEVPDLESGNMSRDPFLENGGNMSRDAHDR